MSKTRSVAAYGVYQVLGNDHGEYGTLISLGSILSSYSTRKRVVGGMAVPVGQDVLVSQSSSSQWWRHS
jgi:hypothetical protein